jgi:small basic protein (TIGR04137 family)
MSTDRSLKTDNATSKHRNVLRRAERIARLKEEGHWPEGHGPYGLQKVANRKAHVGGKVKKKAAATAEGTPEAPAAAKTAS